MSLTAARALLAERAPQLLDEIRAGGDLRRPTILRPERALDGAEALALVQAWQIVNGHSFNEEDVAFFLSRLRVSRAEAGLMGGGA